MTYPNHLIIIKHRRTTSTRARGYRFSVEVYSCEYPSGTEGDKRSATSRTKYRTQPGYRAATLNLRWRARRRAAGETPVTDCLLAPQDRADAWSAAARRRAAPVPLQLRPDKPTSSLVVEGPYRFSRNPIYLGFTLFYGGITALASSLPSALLLPFVLVVMRRGVIEREERYLEREFGEEYLRYKARVRRWI